MRRAAVIVAACALLAVSPATSAAAPVAQVFYVPLPEDQVLATLRAIFPGRGPAACNLAPGAVVEDPVVTYVSIAPVAAGTVITYDHWEDGYEPDIARPVQPTTEVWGDGRADNGTPPGLPADVIGIGDIVVLHNAVRVAARAVDLDFDGGDKIAASVPVAVTRAAWASGTGTPLAGAVEVYETRDWGTRYLAPVGEDVAAGGMFEYSALMVMSSRDGTVVEVDADADGVPDRTATLDEGMSLHVPGVHAGASVAATAPVQVNLATGEICLPYESRWYTLLPADRWSDAYTTPVGSSPGRPTAVFAYNPGPEDTIIGWRTAAGRRPDVPLPAGAVATFSIPGASGARLFSTDGSAFFAIAAVDAGESKHDWGHALIPERMLTPQALLGWGAGRDPSSSVRPNENASPAWVSAVLPDGATRTVAVCADFDGDGRGDLADPFGGRHDRLLRVAPLESARVYDPDGDQTGMVLYVCDDSGARLAVAWGQDPNRATAGEPALDLGTTVPPLPALAAYKDVELVTDGGADGLPGPGDTLRYVITVRNTGRIPLGYVRVVDELPAHTSYVAASSTFDDGGGPAALADAGATPFPLDEGGADLGAIPVGAVFTVTFLVVVDDPLPPGVREVVNRAVVYSPGAETQVEVTLPLGLAASLDVRKSAVVGGPAAGTGTQGYWRNHPESWPAGTVHVGGVEYARDEAIAIMDTPGGGDKTYDLFRQLVAALLNVLGGSDASCVADAIAAAGGWLSAHPPGSGVRARQAAWSGEGASLHARLDDYNNGRLCAPHRDDAAAAGETLGVTFTIEVENTGDVSLTGVAVLDPAMPACNAELGALAPGEVSRHSCAAGAVGGAITNVAVATGTAPGGETVEARGEVFVALPGAEGDAIPQRRSPGRWLRIPGDWPVFAVDAGGSSYGQPAARAILRRRAARGSAAALLRQVLAARLNLLAGADPACIVGTLDAADRWLEEHPPGSRRPPRGARREAAQAAAQLARFNRGAPCAPPAAH